jgi:hypothetical protein
MPEKTSLIAPKKSGLPLNFPKNVLFKAITPRGKIL